MIKPVNRDVVLNVKLLTNPNKFYKVKNPKQLTNPDDLSLTISGCQKYAVNSYAVEITNLKENIAIILQTLKNKCLINIDPVQQDMSLVQEHLGQVLSDLRSKMKHSYDEVIGLVVGGRAYDVENKFADQGRQLTDEIREFLEVEHIPSSQLLEQFLDKNSKGIDVYSLRGNVILSNGTINNFAKQELKTPEQIQNAGEQYFEIFEISPKVPINFVDEIAPDKSTNLRFL